MFERYHLSTVIHNSEQLEMLSAYKQPRGLDVFLKLNTGMNRLGFTPEQFPKALEILNCFTEKREELTLTQLSEITGNYKSTTLRLSRSLENFGYLEREIGGKYKLGPAINRLINVYDSSFNFNALIQKQLEEISRVTNETASFFVRQRSNRICILTSEPAKVIKHTVQIGTLKPIDKGASGHILSAYHDLKIKNKDIIKYLEKIF